MANTSLNDEPAGTCWISWTSRRHARLKPSDDLRQMFDNASGWGSHLDNLKGRYRLTKNVNRQTSPTGIAEPSATAVGVLQVERRGV